MAGNCFVIFMVYYLLFFSIDSWRDMKFFTKLTKKVSVMHLCYETNKKLSDISSEIQIIFEVNNTFETHA